MKTLLLAASLLTSNAFSQNAVILNDAVTYGGHSDGGVYVKGNWYGTNYEANQHSIGLISIFLGGNNLTSNFLRANNGASEIVGTKGTFYGPQMDFEEPDFDYFAGLSNSYTLLGGGSANLSAMNNVTLALNGPLTIYKIQSSQLSGMKTLDFTGQGGVVVFNVTGNLSSWGWSVNYDPSKIVWNFIDATTINIDQRQFTGSLIAPNANVTQSQNINGTLIASDWQVNNSVELHSYPLPSVPEPSVFGLAIVGGLVTCGKRRR